MRSSRSWSTRQAAIAAISSAAAVVIAGCDGQDQRLYIDQPDNARPECVRRVDARSQALEPDGLSWRTAFSSIEDGIASAASALSSTGSCEVWVAGGRYEVYRDSKEDSIDLVRGVSLFGGFSGSELSRSLRDPAVHETVLDGESEKGRVCHVLRAVAEDDEQVLYDKGFARIDGFTVRGGDATCSGAYGSYGGGMLLVNVPVLIDGCRIESNSADLGGGLYMSGYYSMVVSDSELNGNFARERGGGLKLGVTSAAVFKGCRFMGNRSLGDGGGAHVRTLVTFERCLFQDNVSESGNGGGLAVEIAEEDRYLPGTIKKVFVERTEFKGNEAEIGGGIYLGEKNKYILFDLYSSVIRDNRAAKGGGIARLGGDPFFIRSCTLYGNQADLCNEIFSQSDVGNLYIYNSIVWSREVEPVSSLDWHVMRSIHWQYSVIRLPDADERSWERDLIRPDVALSEDPLFVDAEGGDLRLSPDSPYIDIGISGIAPPTDFLDNPRVDHDKAPNIGLGPPWVDLGAFEYVP